MDQILQRTPKMEMRNGNPERWFNLAFWANRAHFAENPTVQAPHSQCTGPRMGSTSEFHAGRKCFCLGNIDSLVMYVSKASSGHEQRVLCYKRFT